MTDFPHSEDGIDAALLKQHTDLVRKKKESLSLEISVTGFRNVEEVRTFEDRLFTLISDGSFPNIAAFSRVVGE